MHDYLIERTIPNPPVVRDDTGRVIALSPGDIAPQTEVYGQHEISELTKSPEKLTQPFWSVSWIVIQASHSVRVLLRKRWNDPEFVCLK